MGVKWGAPSPVLLCIIHHQKAAAASHDQQYLVAINLSQQVHSRVTLYQFSHLIICTMNKFFFCHFFILLCYWWICLFNYKATAGHLCFNVSQPLVRSLVSSFRCRCQGQDNLFDNSGKDMAVTIYLQGLRSMNVVIFGYAHWRCYQSARIRLFCLLLDSFVW